LVDKNNSDVPSIFYSHDISAGEIKWYGDVESLLGVRSEALNTRQKFLKLLHEQDKRSYEMNISSLIDEVDCQYNILVNGSELSLREIAVKTRVGDRQFLNGIITYNTSGHTRPGQGKYNIAIRSILTGKFDSTFLESLRRHYLEGSQNKQTYTLILVSIDNLPMIMNWQGENVALSVMDDVGENIGALLMKDAYCYRVNTDQFGIIVQNPTSNEIEQLVNEIAKFVSIYKHPRLEDSVHLRLSIGSVNFPLGVRDEIDVINKAYLALTNAKGMEGEFYCDFEDAKRDHIDAQNEMAQLHYLQQAYREKRLVIAYQPLVSSKDGTVESYECLLRINDGRGRYESAGRLIGVAEKMGTVETIDEYVLKTVIEEMTETRDVRVNINISNSTTSSEQWLKMCTKELFDEKIASRITFEITETAAQKDLRKTAYFTAAIQGLGSNVSLDDFGVGFTSFRQLRSLSINSIKIDGSFVLGIEENKENLIFIKSLIDFGKSYGLETVAECVETGDIAKKLMEMGVDYMQGYYFGAPDVNKPWLKKAVGS